MNNFYKSILCNFEVALQKLHKKNVRTSEKRVFNKKIYAILEFNFKIA